MESTSAILRRAIIRAMEDGKERDVSEIKEMVREKCGLTYGVDYQEGHIAGSLRVLKNSGKLQLQGRGRYRCFQEEEKAAIEHTQENEFMEPDKLTETCNYSCRVGRPVSEIKQSDRENVLVSSGRLVMEMYQSFEAQYHYLMEQLCLMGTISVLDLTDEELENVRRLIKYRVGLEEILKDKTADGRTAKKFSDTESR